MIWTIEFAPAAAKKEVKALDRQVARRIVRTLEERIGASDDPRALGAALTGIMRAFGAGESAIIA